jgi:hypothetical protein
MKSKIEDWILYTKIGHFIALFGMSVLLDTILLIIYPKLFFYAMMGSLVTAIVICLTDGNKRWV